MRNRALSLCHVAYMFWNAPTEARTSTTVYERGSLARFMALYAALFSAFGLSSPFLPAFLAERGLAPEQLGVTLGAAAALRLVCGPLAGRLADGLHFLRAELALCAALAAGAALLYLAAHGFWTVMAVSLLQAAAAAPLVPLADALSRPTPDRGRTRRRSNMVGCEARARPHSSRGPWRRDRRPAAMAFPSPSG
jgi:MFS family permease